MSAEFYLYSHFVGMLLLFLGVGGMLACSGGEKGRAPALFTISHGVGMLVVIAAGIGRAHKTGIGFPAWIWLKILCLVAIGLMPVLVRRAGMPRAFALLLVAAGGFAAFWLVKNQPSF